MAFALRCTRCGAEAHDDSSFRCHVCHGILEVEYDYSKTRLPKGFRARRPGERKYLPFLPVTRLRASLGEGDTPLRSEKSLGYGAELLLKLETHNPTGTFKDRGSAVEITKALELGERRICCASTGNMGYSLAYYAKRNGIKATVFVSRDASARKVRKIMSQGASLARIDGDFNKALNAAESFARKSGAFVCGDYHYRKEGQKTVGFEIMDQLHYKTPDYIFVPVGNATLISGIFKGLREYKRFGLIRRFPRLVGVESTGADSIVRAVRNRTEIKYMKPKTAADAIAVGYPTFGFECMRALRETRGSAIAVNDTEIEGAVRTLRKAGIGSEPGGAAAYAGFIRMRKKMKGTEVVVVITGNN